VYIYKSFDEWVQNYPYMKNSFECREAFNTGRQIHKELIETLEYYIPLLEDCNKYGNNGDLARDKLAKDSGNKAKAAITKVTGN
jgi:hypothetical protein